ncbi:MAG: glycine cleavage system protein GcvH [Pseudomonadales bacterium]
MAEVREGLRYLSSHEWVRLEDDGTVTVGISDHAQHALGDVVFVELPEVGQSVNPGDDVAVVESVKAASDIYAPLAGKVIAYNDQLEATPETVNESPFDDGWFFKLEIADSSGLDALLSAEDYASLCASEAAD